MDLVGTTHYPIETRLAFIPLLSWRRRDEAYHQGRKAAGGYRPRHGRDKRKRERSLMPRPKWSPIVALFPYIDHHSTSCGPRSEASTSHDSSYRLHQKDKIPELLLRHSSILHHKYFFHVGPAYSTASFGSDIVRSCKNFS